MISQFSISSLPRVIFGDGSLLQTAGIVSSFGSRVLLVTGSKSFPNSDHYRGLTSDMQRYGLVWSEFRVENEPSPQLVDSIVSQFKSAGIQVILGVGGGSVLDTAKAIAGLLPEGKSVMNYLEGVGPEMPFESKTLPFIAIPTTAGTGSESTKNAVLSMQGASGFKKSFRHDSLVPRYAIVDPELLTTCPPALIAANGMDAITQLIESYTSIRANPFMDALAISGLTAARDGLLSWYDRTTEQAEGRRKMAYAALVSGITLAHVGLGAVHGLASPLGAFFPIPHGVVCGTLLAAVTRANIAALSSRLPGSTALEKYAVIGRLFAKDDSLSRDSALEVLVQILEIWTQQLNLSRLGMYGVRGNDVARIVMHCRGSSMKTNPIELTDEELSEILVQRL